MILAFHKKLFGVQLGFIKKIHCCHIMFWKYLILQSLDNPGFGTILRKHFHAFE